MGRIFLSTPHIGSREQEFVQAAFATNWVAPLGPNVDDFEKELARYVGVRAALAVNSGTSAIHLALKLLGVEKGDKVFCSTLTFVASANPILYQNAEPVFIDSEPDTWNMSPIALERALVHAKSLGKLPKAVIVVNLYGQSAKMDEIRQICDAYHVPIVEDAAESLGATYKGKASGTFGKFGIYSFNGNKIITTSGGGMLISDDSSAIEKARFYATQSRDSAIHYQHSEVGYNYRLSNVAAGIGRGQLLVLPERIEARRNNFLYYYNRLHEYPGVSFMPERGFSTRWLTAVLIDPEKAGVTSGEIIAALEKRNIESRPVWKPMHLQPLFQGCDYFTHWDRESFCDGLFENGICLPSGSNLTPDELDRVIETIALQLKPNA